MSLLIPIRIVWLSRLIYSCNAVYYWKVGKKIYILLNSRKSLISFFISSLTQGWFSSWLFNFHEFVDFLGVALLLNSNFNPWWSEKTQVVTNIFLYLWKFALLPSMWSIFEKVPWAAEKKVYSFLFGWNQLYMEKQKTQDSQNNLI